MGCQLARLRFVVSERRAPSATLHRLHTVHFLHCLHTWCFFISYLWPIELYCCMFIRKIFGNRSYLCFWVLHISCLYYHLVYILESDLWPVFLMMIFMMNYFRSSQFRFFLFCPIHSNIPFPVKYFFDLLLYYRNHAKNEENFEV